MYAFVLIQYGVKTLNKTFTYKIPRHLNVSIGNRVKVPFNNKYIYGIVLDIKNDSELNKVEEIKEVINPEIKLSDELIKLGKYISGNYFCTLIKAYQTMLPSSLKVKENNTNYQKYNKYIILNKSLLEIKDYIKNNKRCKSQIIILENLLRTNKIIKSELNSSVKTLLEKKLVKEELTPIYRINNNAINTNKMVLTSEQNNIINEVELDKRNTYLIHGVTGSGKTQVYIELIKKVIKRNKTAIVLIPEISLTAQMVNRFYNVFGDNVAIMNSSLSDGEKFDEYNKIIKNDVNVVVGTRSAIFVPFKNIGIIIIDEEHSTTYKQENTPRYNTIKIAEFRSAYNNCPLILGSATPSLESYARAKKGVYKLLTMKNRVNNYNLPSINIIDMTKEVKKGNMYFSEKLTKDITETLNNNNQVMLLLNRRGYSTIVNCSNCGYTYKCPHCEITLTYHKSTNNLRCHYCGYTVLKSDICPNCKEEGLKDFGVGTEKIEKELNNLFPDSRILRMDADTTTKKGSHEKYIKMIENHEVDIIIGTQMISKGLDFKKVTLVGVISADDSLNIPDFRSMERTFSLLNQVSGRAGRNGDTSKVDIQTYNKDNIIFKFVSENDYVGLYNYEMNIRKKLKYSPYYYLVGIKVCSKDYDIASKSATKVSSYLKKHIGPNTIVLGPTTANMFKYNNIYRFQIIIKYKYDKILFESLKEIDEMFINEKDVYLEIDNDPISI